MRIRFVFVFVAVAATFAALASSAAPADEIGLAPARSTFPERAYVLSLPTGKRLRASDVKVTENGHRVVDLSVVPSESSKVASGTILAIDASRSMRGAPIKGALEAAQAFAKQRNADHRLAILTFNSSTRAGPFTVSQEAIDRTLTRAPRLRFGTHLYSALAQGIQQIRAEQIDAGSIVVLSDGADVGSGVTLEQVVQAAKKANVRIFTVGLH